MGDNVCYWECIGDPDYELPWKAECGGRTEYFEGDWKYCPFCGRELYEVGHDSIWVAAFRPTTQASN